MQIACSWNEAPSNIPNDRWQMLSTLYDSPSDIDLFTGGLSEVPLKGALVGPTFACVIGIQFQKAKKCDR